MKELKNDKSTDTGLSKPESDKRILTMAGYFSQLVYLDRRRRKINLAETVMKWEKNRILAQLALAHKCPEYFVLFDPYARAHSTELDIEKAMKNLIKARYPKFYEEVFEKED